MDLLRGGLFAEPNCLGHEGQLKGTPGEDNRFVHLLHLAHEQVSNEWTGPFVCSRGEALEFGGWVSTLESHTVSESRLNTKTVGCCSENRRRCPSKSWCFSPPGPDTQQALEGSPTALCAPGEKKLGGSQPSVSSSWFSGWVSIQPTSLSLAGDQFGPGPLPLRKFIPLGVFPVEVTG